MSRRRARYAFTPKRKAVLRKAQLISAQKRRRRRRNIALAAGGVGVLAGVGAGAYIGHRYVRGLKGGPARPQIQLSSSKALDLVRVSPNPAHDNWPHVGRAVTRTVLGNRVRRKRLNYVQWEQKRVKADKARLRKNYKARRKYWRSKPVGGKKRG